MKFIRVFRTLHISHYSRRIYWSVFLLFAALSSGIVGFVLIEDYSFLEAFYMTIITISTVGFGEIKPLSSEGRVFTSLLIVVNIGIFAYAISSLSSFFLDGDLRALLKNAAVKEKIGKLRNHVIICGFGRYGIEVALELDKQNMPFVIVENDADKEEDLKELGYLYLLGDATQDKELEDVGIQKAKAIILTLADDAENVYVSLTAREICPSITIITRAGDARNADKMRRAGANYVITPEILGGYHMATLVSNPGVIAFFDFMNNMNIHVKEVACREFNEEHLGKSIGELKVGERTGVHILGIKNKENYNINPKAITVIDSEMKFIIVGDKSQLELFDNQFLK